MAVRRSRRGRASKRCGRSCRGRRSNPCWRLRKGSCGGRHFWGSVPPRRRGDRRPDDGRRRLFRRSDGTQVARFPCLRLAPCRGGGRARAQRASRRRGGRSSWATRFLGGGPAVVRARTRHGPEHHLNLGLIHVCIQQLDDLIESFLSNGGLGLLEELVLTFDHRPAYDPLTGLVPLEAFSQRHIEEEKHARNLVPSRQVQKIFPRLGREGRRIHNAQTVQDQALLDEEMNKSEGLGLESLVALVIANPAARPIGRDDLSRPKPPRREGGLATRRRAAQNHHRRPHQTNGFWLRRSIGVACCRCHGFHR
jgi:hypothetical protein